MTKLGTDDVIHVAKLANLSLSDSEVDKFQKQLSDIVDYISELNCVDTSGVEPTSQCTGLENVTREDEIKVEEILSSDQALSGTDNTYNSYFKVKAILQERKHK